MKKIETVRKLVRQTTAQGESSCLKEELQTEELLQQVEEMKLALLRVDQQFRQNQELLKGSIQAVESMIQNQQVLHQEIQRLKKEIQKFRKARDTGNWILRMLYFGIIIVVAINLGMMVVFLMS